MDWWIYLLIGIGAVIVLLLAVVLIRTFSFKPKANIEPDNEEITFDKEKAISNLTELVKCKTISYANSKLEDKKEFEKLFNLIPKLFPNVVEHCQQIPLKERGLFFKWEGRKRGEESVLMAHFDVVPVDEEKWDKKPFAGIIEDGVLWGRGTIDTKVTFSATLTAVDHLIAQGFVPLHDVYLAFSGTEEINGPGAKEIVNYFKERNIVPEFVIDEGGAVVENVFPGVKCSCGLIGIAEKGMVDVKFTAKSNGGHASSPEPHSPVVELANACTRIENKPFKYHLTKPVAEMFDILGRRSSFVYKMIFANLWLFKGILNKMCIKKGGMLNALLRTTVAFTQLSGSQASNVIPPEATMVANLRLNPVDTKLFARDYLAKTSGSDKIDVSIVQGMNPSRISPTNCEPWNRIAKSVASTWKGCVVSPYLMVQCSDSRHYSAITDKVYRFSAQDMTDDERKTIHGNNERIRLDAIVKSVEFYIRLIKQC